MLEIYSNGRRVKTIDDAGEREHIKLIQDEGSIFCRGYILEVEEFVGCIEKELRGFV